MFEIFIQVNSQPSKPHKFNYLEISFEYIMNLVVASHLVEIQNTWAYQ
jgi:hypothetical protein